MEPLSLCVCKCMKTVPPFHEWRRQKIPIFFHQCPMINEKCEECNELFEYVERLLRLEPFSLGFLPALSHRRSFSISLSSCILPSHCISISSNLLLTNVKKQGLRMKHKIFLVSYAGKIDTFNVCLCIWVGLVMLSMSTTLGRTTLLSNSCSQPLVLKQHLLGEGNSSSSYHDNRNEFQLLIHLVGDSLF